MLLGSKTFCSTCAVRPDVDYLEAFRLKHWGKRDGWAWALGMGGLINGAVTLALVASSVGDLSSHPENAVPLLALAAVTAFSSANGIVFWLGYPIARWGLLLATTALTAVEMAAAGPAGLAVAVIPSVVTVNIFINWRTRLFFKLPVKRATLQRAWDILHNNSVARQATIAGVAGLVIPGFGLLALIMGIIGLRRVDPNAYPPVGKKAYAIAGIVLGAIGVIEWLAIVGFYQFFSRM